MVAEVAGERAPAARVGEAAAEDAVGAGHVRGVAEDGADVLLGPVPGAEADDRRPPCPRPAGSRRRNRPRARPAAAAASATFIPSAHRQSGSATMAIVVVSSGYGVGYENHSASAGRGWPGRPAARGSARSRRPGPTGAARPCPGSCCRRGRDRYQRSGRGPAPAPDRSAAAGARPGRYSARHGAATPESRAIS